MQRGGQREVTRGVSLTARVDASQDKSELEATVASLRQASQSIKNNEAGLTGCKSSSSEHKVKPVMIDSDGRLCIGPPPDSDPRHEARAQGRAVGADRGKQHAARMSNCQDAWPAFDTLPPPCHIR
jgi:hypothetical protein